MDRDELAARGFVPLLFPRAQQASLGQLAVGALADRSPGLSRTAIVQRVRTDDDPQLRRHLLS
jgi:hypothetical protein